MEKSGRDENMGRKRAMGIRTIAACLICNDLRRNLTEMKGKGETRVRLNDLSEK